MTLPTFADFEQSALQQGFDEVAERIWEPGTVVEDHGHPFAVQALVVQGEMWLTQKGATRHLKPGDRFALDLGEPHTERYGSAGATYWAARRHTAG